MNFYVEGYAHYSSCSICVIYSPIRSLQIQLTRDRSEFGKSLDFPEKFKLFKIGKNKYTLKQIWDRIRITEIKYFEERDD